jgi:glycosyltransferase involved in cell wall biosynthesis
MKIADMTSTDTGGQSYKLARAINRCTEHTSRSFVKSLNYINYRYDILYGEHDLEFVRNYLSNVNIIHCHNKYRNVNGWFPINKNARWIIHQHGRFAGSKLPDEFVEVDKIRNAYRIVSTINLLNYVDYDINRWLPAPFDIKEFEEIKRKNYIQTNKVKIAHSPTRRDYKNTELLIKLVRKIPNLELVLIENQTNEEALRLKSMCDITFDQMHLCYGNSGLEGMCFGQAVIVGPTDAARDLVILHIGYEPYVYATADTLYDVLKTLTYDADYRNHYALWSKKYVKEFHDECVVANKIINIYKKQ